MTRRLFRGDCVSGPSEGQTEYFISALHNLLSAVVNCLITDGIVEVILTSTFDLLAA